MSHNNERLDRNEQRNSLAAFLRTLKFHKPKSSEPASNDAFAQPQPRVRQRGLVNEENRWIRSAN